MNTVKGIALAFVVALVLSVAVQAQMPICNQNSAVNSVPACSGEVVTWSVVPTGTLQLLKDGEGRYDVGKTGARHTDKTLAHVWHENWEFHEGKLHILKPMEVIYKGDAVQIGRTAPDKVPYDSSPGVAPDTGPYPIVGSTMYEYGPLGEVTGVHNDGCNTTTCYKSGLCSSTTAYCVKAGESSVIADHGMNPMPPPRAVYAKPEHFDQSIDLSQAIVGAGAAQATPTICGQNVANQTQNIDLLQISCVDFSGLRAVAPGIPWPAKPKTQVLVHIRDGDAVRVTVGDQVQFADLVNDSERRRVAMLQFEGIDHTSVAVKVYREVQ